jgi:hypothetical protein
MSELGIYGVNSAQYAAPIGRQLRGCMTEARAKFVSAAYPSPRPLIGVASLSFLRTPCSRQKQSLSSPSDRLQAGVLVTGTNANRSLRQSSKSVFSFRRWGHEGGLVTRCLLTTSAFAFWADLFRD